MPRRVKTYKDVLVIPDDYVEVYHQLEYVREQCGLTFDDVHAHSINEDAQWMCNLCDTKPSRMEWSLAAVKRHDESHGHLRHIAARYNVDPSNLGRKRFCALCQTWIVDPRAPNWYERHWKTVHPGKTEKWGPAEDAILYAWWQRVVPFVKTRPRQERRANAATAALWTVGVPLEGGDLDEHLRNEYFADLEEQQLMRELQGNDQTRTPFGDTTNDYAMDVDNYAGPSGSTHH